MLFLSQIRALTLANPSHKNRHAHLSAASGLVHAGTWLYVVADDEKHLGLFLHNSDDHGTLQRLLPGDLPLVPEERKAEKPDLEVLTLIPISKKYPNGALLALGSGSKDKREQGVIISFSHQGNLNDDLDVIDLTLLYHHLKNKIGKLNIEGAVIIDEDIILFQRGNKKNNINSTIRFPLKQFYQTIFSADHEIVLDTKVTHYELGEIDGIPLCFTDATPLPNGAIVFTAAAEDTSDAYFDGICKGSAIGVINANGKLHSLQAVDKLVKAEGVEATVIDNKVHLLLVTDADDETAPAQLYSAVLEGYPFS
jgi:hypothetical protein